MGEPNFIKSEQPEKIDHKKISQKIFSRNHKMEYEMETDYQQDYIAQTEPNQDEYQQIQYLYSMLYQMMPRFEDQESMDDEEMELVLNAIEYIKALNYQLVCH